MSKANHRDHRELPEFRGKNLFGSASLCALSQESFFLFPCYPKNLESTKPINQSAFSVISVTPGTSQCPLPAPSVYEPVPSAYEWNRECRAWNRSLLLRKRGHKQVQGVVSFLILFHCIVLSRINHSGHREHPEFYEHIAFLTFLPLCALFLQAVIALLSAYGSREHRVSS
jgi:hypothetical protein